MGKGFNNYMCKKFFHPASRDNLKRVWMAQQKDDAYKKKQDELRVQYEKEQDLYNNKAMLSKESKDKLSVNFMYEPPPGAKKEREKEENEPEYKFEWQRKYNAPREDYCKGNSEIQDQPFGILVRNVRCIKCRKWGHINTDKECPMYNQSVTSEIANEAADALSLLRGMREDGLRMRKTALDAQQHVDVPRLNGMKKVEEEADQEIDSSELQFLKALSTKDKLKLLKKLEKLESNEIKKNNSESSSDESGNHEKKKKKERKKKHGKSDKKLLKKKKKSKKYKSSSEDSDQSEEEDEDEEKNRKKKKSKEIKKKHKKAKDDSDEEERERTRRRRHREKEVSDERESEEEDKHHGRRRRTEAPSKERERRKRREGSEERERSRHRH